MTGRQTASRPPGGWRIAAGFAAGAVVSAAACLAIQAPAPVMAAAQGDAPAGTRTDSPFAPVRAAQCLPTEAVATAPSAAPGLPGASATFAGWPLRTADRQQFRNAINALKSDRAARQALADQYLHEPDAESRERLRDLLSALPQSELDDLARKLARSDDPALRAEAFDVLALDGNDTPATRDFIRTALRTERDPTVLSQALQQLQPTLVSPDESSAIVAQLHDLMQSPSASVRASALQAMARWDKSSEFQGSLADTLQSPDSTLREAAVAAIAENTIRTDAVKAGLLRIAGNAEETADVRLQATQALANFPLDASEYATVMQARAAAAQQEPAD